MKAPRTLYFDIDGVLLDYDDQPKRALVGGQMQRAIIRAGIETMVCVSGWSDIVHARELWIPAEQRPHSIARIVRDIFEEDWLVPRLVLTTDTDHRARHIDRNSDWYYVDDWADRFYGQQFGAAEFQAELGRRICMPDPRGDGSDILAWLKRIQE